jgi:hypothetical protein
VIIAADGDDPTFTYFAIEHYNGEWKTPIVLISTPLADKTRRQILEYQRVWVVGPSSADDIQRLLKGCPIAKLQESSICDSVWRIK